MSELVISPDFRTVRSDFSNSYYYALNGDLMLRDYAPRSIIPNQKVFHPKKLEIWVFDDAPALVNQNESHQYDYENSESLSEPADYTQQQESALIESTQHEL